MDTPFLRAYRSVGLFCDQNGLVLNQTKDKDFLVASTDRSYKVYSLPNLQVKLNGIELAHRITCLAAQNEIIFLAQKNTILRLHTYHIQDTFHGHSHKVIGLLLLGDLLLSWDHSNLLLVREVAAHKNQQQIQEQPKDQIISNIQLQFAALQIVHPPTYLNKVLVVGSYQMILLNIKTGKTIHQFSSILSDPTGLGQMKITVVQHSPVLNVIGVGYSDGTVQMIDLLQDRTIMTLQHPTAVLGLAFSPEDRPLLAVGDRLGSITLWDLKEQQILSKWQAHSQAVTSLVFSAGNLLYSSSGHSNHIVQWKYDPEDKLVFHLLREKKGLQGQLQKVRFADALGYDVLTHSNHSTAELKNILLNNEGFLPQYSLQPKQGRKIKYQEHIEQIGEIKDYHMAFNNKFKHVLVRTAGSKQFFIFDSENKRILKRKLDLQGTEGLEEAWLQQQHIVSIWVTNCGNFGMVGYDQGLLLKFNMQSHRVVGHTLLRDIHQPKLIVSDMGNTQILIADDHWLISLDFLTLEQKCRTKMESGVAKWCLSRVNDLLVIAHHDHRIRVYNPSLETCRVFPGHSMPILDLCFSHDQRYVFSSALDRKLIVWDLISQKIVNQVITKKPLKSLDVSNDGELVATISQHSRQVDLWHNVLYLTPSTQTLLNLSFTTPLALLQQQDARIYHYLFRRDQSQKQNEVQLAQQIDQQKLKEYIQIDPKDKRDPDHNLLQLTDQQINKWMPLIDLDRIKQKNKVTLQEAQETKLPFFLDFENKAAIKEQYEEEKVQEKQQRSQILEKQKQKHMEEEGNLLEQLVSSSEIDLDQSHQVLQYLKSLEPSQVDYQLRQHCFQHIVSLLQVMSLWFDSSSDYDLKSTYLNALLNLGYDAILSSAPARLLLSQIQTKEALLKNSLQDHLLKSICLLEKFTCIKS